ncbi:aldose epimerase family protein [Bradyrhizobium lablabi]|uniref:aldose epimerase family protein n=1 Tax=Bradyrhizobium lablabi TaxID=722472 RepID=UPI0009A71480|nr:aldose epimerase family protein [Bradyrhizobium lablabi]
MDRTQTPKVTRTIFGHLPDGTAIEMVRLCGDGGFEVRIITYGAVIQSIFAPDRAGRLADVVLGRDDLAGYAAIRRFLGATVGRYANRIANGTFELDGDRYQLPANDGANALHGGLAGFDRKAWSVTDIGESPVPFVTLSYVSPDGEEGYPGRLATQLSYSISGGIGLSVAFSAVTDKPTIVNLTNHSFFNLSGVEGSGDILDHHLTIAADTYLPVSAAGIPLEAPSKVDATPFDFRSPHPVGARLRDANEQIQIRKGYDHNFCLRGSVTNAPRLAARLEDPSSGRVLELLTDQPGVQFYSGNFLDGTVTGKYGRVHRQYDALCLEPQRYPDTPNRPAFPSARLDPGQAYHHTSLYRFSASRRHGRIQGKSRGTYDIIRSLLVGHDRVRRRAEQQRRQKQTATTRRLGLTLWE